jgi:hypothetical protein
MNVLEIYRELKDYYPDLHLIGFDTSTTTIVNGDEELFKCSSHRQSGRNKILIFLSGMLTAVLINDNKI